MSDTTTLITRKAYLDRCGEPGAFRAYYAQFVDDAVTASVARNIGLERIAASDDEHLNDVPLRLWDQCLVSSTAAAKLRECGDYLTQAGVVCIAKEAARQMVARR